MKIISAFFHPENVQLTNDGRIVNERDWRRNTLSAERSSNELEEKRKRARQKELELKNNKSAIYAELELEYLFHLLESRFSRRSGMMSSTGRRWRSGDDWREGSGTPWSS